ncbi:MAG: hypothetical protein WC484_03565 [Candidatus Omnitrophota bacterium]
MRIKNFSIFFVALFLSAAFSSFAKEDTPAVEVKPAAGSTSEAKPAANPVAETKPTVDTAAEAEPAIHPAIEVKPAANPATETKPTVDTAAEAEPAIHPAIEVKPAAQGGTKVKPVVNLFAEHFFAPASQKLDHGISEVRGFPVLKSHSREQNAEFSIVTDFGGGIVKSRHLSGLKDMKAVDEHIKKNLKTTNFEGVEIRQLSIPNAKGQATELYWVGERAFASAEEAMTAIIATKSMMESQGGDFAEAVRAAPIYVPEAEKPIEIKTPAQFKKEEELVLKFTDQLGIGEKMYGVLQGPPCGTPITWQSFGETSWRLTNLAANHFDTQVGYWTNRLVFSGIRFPLHNIDPFIESTIALQSDSADYASNLQNFVGLEWRPLARNPWLLNFQPFGGIPILEWMRNYRFYIKYGNRYNIKGEITGSKDYDLIWGVQCYYEWGTELPALNEGKPEKFTDYLRQYVWGEYFGNYYVSKTDFGSEKSFNAFIANSTITLGIKLPGIPIPHNYINDQIILMPYMRFEHVNNASFSYWYQNQYFVGAGLRWMPFMAYKWKENEWLAKTAVFVEYDGIGGTQRAKQQGTPGVVPNYDLRVGVKFSSRRF